MHFKVLDSELYLPESILGQQSEAPTMSYSEHLHLKELRILCFVILYFLFITLYEHYPHPTVLYCILRIEIYSNQYFLCAKYDIIDNSIRFYVYVQN